MLISVHALTAKPSPSELMHMTNVPLIIRFHKGHSRVFLVATSTILTTKWYHRRRLDYIMDIYIIWRLVVVFLSKSSDFVSPFRSTLEYGMTFSIVTNLIRYISFHFNHNHVPCHAMSNDLILCFPSFFPSLIHRTLLRISIAYSINFSCLTVTFIGGCVCVQCVYLNQSRAEQSHAVSHAEVSPCLELNEIRVFCPLAIGRKLSVKLELIFLKIGQTDVCLGLSHAQWRNANSLFGSKGFPFEVSIAIHSNDEHFCCSQRNHGNFLRMVRFKVGLIWNVSKYNDDLVD